MQINNANFTNLELSKQEQVVVAGIVKGLKNTEIAAFMNISINTVKTYQARVYRKCCVRNRVELTLWYYENIRQINL